jgi:hypothetical protein
MNDVTQLDGAEPQPDNKAVQEVDAEKNGQLYQVLADLSNLQYRLLYTAQHFHMDNVELDAALIDLKAAELNLRASIN